MTKKNDAVEINQNLIATILTLIEKMKYYSEDDLNLIQESFASKEKTELFDYSCAVIYELLKTSQKNNYIGLTESAKQAFSQLENKVDDISAKYLKQFNALNDLLEQGLINPNDYPLFHDQVILKSLNDLEKYLKSEVLITMGDEKKIFHRDK